MLLRITSLWKALLVVALSAGLSGAASMLAQTATAAPAILEVKPVTFPAYDSSRRIALYAPTPAEYTRALEDRAFVMERVTYRSDDLEVYAYFYRPATPPKDRKLPVVIFNRGSYTRNDFSYEVLMLANRLAHRGYLVVAPMLRGSGGAAGHDEMGGADLHDLFNIVAVLKEIEYADPARIFLCGESRGGIMGLLAARDGFPARAAAVWGAITDLGLFFKQEAARRTASGIWPGWETREAEIVASRSALHWPEKINIPVLIMNGGADTDVPPVHALQLATALEKLRKPYELKIFHGEQHVLSGRAAERDEDIVRWFRRFDVETAFEAKP